MAFDISSVLGNLGSLVPSSNEIANQLVTGAVASVVLAGAKSSAGQDALDPLHLFHQQTSATGTGTMVVGKTMPASVFQALVAAGKADVAVGYTIVAG